MTELAKASVTFKLIEDVDGRTSIIAELDSEEIKEGSPIGQGKASIATLLAATAYKLFKGGQLIPTMEDIFGVRVSG